MKDLARLVIPMLDKLAAGLVTAEPDLARACMDLSGRLTRYAGPDAPPPPPPA